MIARRSLLRAMIAAPFIVKASSLMPVRSLALDTAPLSVDWLIMVDGLDECGRPRCETFRYVGGGFHTTAIRWQAIGSIAAVNDEGRSLDGL